MLFSYFESKAVTSRSYKIFTRIIFGFAGCSQIFSDFFSGKICQFQGIFYCNRDLPFVCINNSYSHVLLLFSRACDRDAHYRQASLPSLCYSIVIPNFLTSARVNLIPSGCSYLAPKLESTG